MEILALRVWEVGSDATYFSITLVKRKNVEKLKRTNEVDLDYKSSDSEEKNKQDHHKQKAWRINYIEEDDNDLANSLANTKVSSKEPSQMSQLL